MPLHLEPMDIADELQNFRSVLFVSCPICPPVSLATERQAPIIDFFRRGIKTPAYETFLDELRKPLENRGIRTGVFAIYTPTPAMCLWTKGQRKRLLKRSRDYQAVVVMGCESAKYTVEQTLRSADCEVVPGMRLVGITNATLRSALPFTVSLDDLARVRANEQPEGGESVGVN